MPEMNSEQLIERMSEKMGIASAMTHARRVTVETSASHVAQPARLLTWRAAEWAKILLWRYLQTTVVLIEPEMKITGSAMPKTTREIRGPAERRAGDYTVWPTKR